MTFLARCSVFAAQSLTLAWDASPDTNVVGYYVYYGPQPGNYTSRLDAGTNLTVTTPSLPPGIYYFSATSRNASGDESRFATSINAIIAAPDTTPPTVVTTWPKANTTIPNGQKCVNGSSVTTAPDVPLSGAVSDNGVITDVTVTRIVPNWAPLTVSPPLVGPYNSKTWTNLVRLVDGTNTFRIVASDSAGFTSTVLRTIFLRTIDQLNVVTNGYGTTAATGVLTFGSARNGALLQIGRSYLIKATAKPGNWFVNWTDTSGAVVGTNATLNFLMTNHLVLTANFATNAIVAYHLAGAYNGLFAEDAGARVNSAGSVSGIKVTTSRTYSGKLFVGGASYSISGFFDPSGKTIKTINRNAKPNLVVALQMDFTHGTKQITGTVSSAGEGWFSPLLANLACYSATNPNPMAGRYTMAIPPLNAVNADSPVGYGYGLITNSPTGNVSLTGALADMTSITCSAPLGQNGDWPVCIDLYSHQGLLFGWLNLSNGAPAGRLAWIKPAQPPATNMVSKLFPAGVENAVDVVGSVYRTAAPIVALTGGSLELDLATASPATYSVAFTNNNTITSSTHITGSVTAATGLIKLTLPTAIAGGATRTAYGVVLQSSNAAVGTVSGINAAIYIH